MPVKGWRKDNPKGRKGYRFKQETIDSLEVLQEVSGRTETDIIEAAISFIHDEYLSSSDGLPHDNVALMMVLGKRNFKERVS